jgi:hypothetical protein
MRDWLSTCEFAVSLSRLESITDLSTTLRSVGSMRIWVVAT